MTCYFFVDSDGTENVSNRPPLRHPNNKFWVVLKDNILDGNIPYVNENNIDKLISYDLITELPRNTIESLFGKKLKWEDSPIKIDFNY